jgi:hypothetical protein
MDVENPDAQLAIYINSLSNKKLNELLKHCQQVVNNVRNTDEINKKKRNEKSKSNCKFLLYY